MAKTFYKDPDSVLPYGIDWAAEGANDGAADDPGWLQGDTISTSAWVVDAGLTADSDSNTTTTTTVTLSGGTVGQTYRCRNRIVTAAGATVDASIFVRITES